VAERELEAACELLIDPSPENLDRCSAVLASAAAHVAAGPMARGERGLLRVSIGRASRLLETAADYHRQWQKILRGLTGSGYTVAGELSAAPVRGRVSIEG